MRSDSSARPPGRLRWRSPVSICKFLANLALLREPVARRRSATISSNSTRLVVSSYEGGCGHVAAILPVERQPAQPCDPPPDSRSGLASAGVVNGATEANEFAFSGEVVREDVIQVLSAQAKRCWRTWKSVVVMMASDRQTRFQAKRRPGTSSTRVAVHGIWSLVVMERDLLASGSRVVAPLGIGNE